MHCKRSIVKTFSPFDVCICSAPSLQIAAKVTVQESDYPSLEIHAAMTETHYKEVGSIKVTTRPNSVEIAITLPDPTNSAPLIGGYDCTPIDDTLTQKYTCLICKLLQREPTIVSCCGQHFCKLCLHRSVWGGTQECPHCRARDLQFFTNKQQRREIACLRVRCPHQGCLWTGEVREVEGHVDASRCEQGGRHW